MQPHPMEEEEDEEEQPGIRRPVNVVRAPRYRDVHEDDVDVDDDDERDEDDEDDDVTPRRRRRVARAESLSDSGADDGESEAGQDPDDDVLPQPAATAATAKEATPDLTEDEDDLVAQAAEVDDVESENDTASEEDDPEAVMDVDEDVPEPSPPTVNGAPAPIATAAAPPAPPVVASIMGAAVIDDAASQSASPSPSPPPEDAPDGDAPEPDDIEADAEVEDEAADAETEADLQHEHRAEALDTLATIELKFALLRERVYVEKMEALAWEEALVKNGSHPELLHLHSELSRRRDKRIELAARRRSYEIANILKRRRSEESAVWSWWMLARDELQTTMVAETNRKRRKLERDRRATERPQPVFRLPHFPHEHFQHEIPIPPTLHEIVNSKSQRSTSSSGRRGKDLPAPLRAYPSFSSLSSREITEDLDYLSIIDGRQSPHHHGTIRSRQRLPQWESYSICPRTGVPQRRHQHLRPDDGIPPVPPAYSTNWIMVQGRSVDR
ncbi:Sds3-like-domain-containing protein [Russula aff. rugulosa BPL654]|nr:Sds3-like-domain-containing protein [Russula aff. rugulosa BPL654]